MGAGGEENGRYRKRKYAIICVLSSVFGVFFLILSGYMLVTQSVSLFEYEGSTLLPGNLRGLKFREVLWTICAAAAGVGNGWWYAKLYNDIRSTSHTDKAESQNSNKTT